MNIVGDKQSIEYQIAERLGLKRVEILYPGTRVPVTREYSGTRYHSILGMPT